MTRTELDNWEVGKSETEESRIINEFSALMIWREISRMYGENFCSNP